LISENETCVPCRTYSAPLNGSPEKSENINDCLKNRSYDRLWVLFPYTGRYRKLLTAYKFKKNLVLADFFAEKIICKIEENPELFDAVIVPVPPRPGKTKESGWDQVDYLVKRIKKFCKEKNIKFYLRRKKSKIQKQLNRKDRLENLKNRIYAPNGSVLAQTVLIIDDVITTGSTMEVCAKALKEGGVKNIYGLCLFYD